MSSDIEKKFVESLRIDKSALNKLNLSLGEIIVENITDSQVLKDLPVAGALTGVFKLGRSVNDAFLIKKLIRFFSEPEDIDERKKLAFIQKLELDPAYRQKVVEKTIVILDRLDSEEKTSMLAKALKSLITDQIDFNMYSRLCSIINLIFIDDIAYLRSLAIDENAPYEVDKIASLMGLGLVSNMPKNMNETEGQLIYEAKATQVGYLLAQILEL